MKKIISLAVLAAVGVSAADAAPSHIARNRDGSYNVTYDYNDKAKNGWYVGGRAGLSLMSWENDYSSDAPGVNLQFNSDKYSFEPVFGGSVFAGRTFKYFWRAEVEAGLIGRFEDKDDGFEFRLTVPYLMANGYYDFANGLYVGAGLGIAVPKTELDGADFESGGRSEHSVSAMGALMFGYTHKLDYNLVLDVRYRLAAFGGTEHERQMDTGYDFKNEVGLILDNSVSVGLRYEF